MAGAISATLRSGPNNNNLLRARRTQRYCCDLRRRPSMFAIKDPDMTNRPRSACATFFKLTPLFAAIAGQLLLASGATAAPAGGVVVGGTGTIEQTGLDTTITQNSDRLAVDWASFNIAADERVAFVQPDQNAMPINHTPDPSGSRLLGSIDATGHVT